MQKYIKLILIYVFIYFLVAHSYGQNGQITDSLLKCLQTAKTDTQKIKLYCQLANKNMRTDINLAKSFIDTAQLLSKTTEEIKYLSMVAAVSGELYLNYAIYDKAQMYYLQYLKYCDELSDTLGLIRGNANIGTIYYSLGDLSQAVNYYTVAVKYCEQMKNIDISGKLSSIYNNLGNVYEDKNVNDSALYYYRKSRYMALRAKDYVNLGNVYNNMGMLFNKIGVKDSVLFCFEKSLEYRVSCADKMGIARSYCNIGKYFLIEKQYAKALYNLNNAYTLAIKYKNLSTQKDALEYLAELYEEQNRLDSSLFYYKKFSILKDSIKNEKITSQITKMELEFEFEKKEKNALIQQQKEKFRFTIIIIALGALLIIIALLYVLLRSRVKRMKLLSKNLELEKTNLSKDLEIRNKELATNVIYMVRKNELLNSVTERLLQIKSKIPPDNQPDLQRVVYELQRNSDKEIWKEFEFRFQNVHGEFYKKLLQLYPDLTHNEVKLCAFLKLNMNTKDIAALLQKSEKSVSVARTRLRKKLNLTNQEIDLSNFLTQI